MSNMSVWYRVWGCMIVVFCSLQVFPVNYKFRHYTVEHGLGSNTIRDIVQDRTGYIWMATTDGLSRFSATGFKTFRHDPDDRHSLGSNEVQVLCEDSSGKLWIGSKGAVYIFDPKTEYFSRFDDKGHFSPFAVIMAIAEDKKSNIWLGTYGDGLFRYDPKSDTLIEYKKTSVNQNNDSIPDIISRILVDHEGKVWVCPLSGRFIYLYCPEADSFKAIRLWDGVVEKNLDQILAICEDSQGNIWIAGENCEILKLDADRKFFKFLPPLNKEFVVQRIRSIIEYKPGMLMMGTNNGILLYNYVTGHWEKIDCNRNDWYGLNDGFVHALSKDSEGGIWIGTYFGGVNYLSPISFCFELYQDPPIGGVSERFIVSKFCEDRQKNIWIGSDNGGLGKFNPETGEFIYVPVDPVRPGLNIHALWADSEELWIGTYMQGIYRKNINTGKITFYPFLGGVTSMYRDGLGVLWLGTKSGIMTYRPDKDCFEDVINPGVNCDVQDIVEDDQGNVWFASYGGGLISYQTLTKEVNRYSDEERKPGYITRRIRALCFHRKRLWVGTADHGLLFWDSKQKCLMKPRDNNEFALTTVHSIIAHDDHLWITTNKGLARYNIENGNVSWYNQEDGLQGKLFNPNAGIKSSTGKIYIGGSNGFNVFDPNQIVGNSYPPQVVFTGFRLFNQELPVDSAGILRQHINFQRSVVLRARQNAFTIDFAALSYCESSKTDYRYILEGLEKEWTEIKDNELTSASYTNLSPGNYIFKIKANNNDEAWTSETAQVFITVLPPWWKTLCMQFVYIFLIIGSVIGVFVGLLRKIQRRQAYEFRELKQKNEKELLASKIRIFQEIAHEIRTPVTLIAAPAEEIIKYSDLPESVREDLGIIKKNSDRLVELMNQMLDFSRVESEFSQINNRQVDIAEYLTGVIDRFVSIAKGKGIAIELKILSEVSFKVWLDVESFDKIISNLMTNALKYTRDRIEVVLELPDRDQSFFAVTVKDNGVGIEDKQKIFDLFYSSSGQNNVELQGFGIGLAVVSLLLKKMNASIEVDSQVGEYAAFHVQFPLNGATNSSTLCSEENEIMPEKQTENQEDIGVLVVEDNETLRNFLARSLSVFYRVRTAANGEAAIKELEHGDIDVVVSDIIMPLMDGWALCNYIKNNMAISHIPIILLTARTDVDSKIKALENGADVYIEKPVVMKYLYAQIAGILDKRKQLRETFSRLPLSPLSNVAKNEKEEEFIVKVNQIIEENISNSEFSMDEIADSLFMSRSAMYAKIKAISGLTPNHFVRLIRLRKAAELFRSGENYKINEVCYLVGFSSPSYFAKCFQQQFGMLPGDFVNPYKS